MCHIYLDSHKSCIHLHIGVDICAVPMADAIVPGDVSYYIILYFEFLGLWKRSARGTAVQRNDPWLAKMGKSNKAII